MIHIIRANNEKQTILASSDGSKHDIIIVQDNWYFHPEQVSMEYLVKSDKTWICPDRGTGYWYNLEAPGLTINNVAWCYPDAGGVHSNIRGLIGFWGRETAASIAEITDTYSEHISHE